MRRGLVLAVVAGLLVVAAVSWLGAQNAATGKPLAEILPSGALVYLEARDLGGLLGEWNRLGEKRRPMLTAVNATGGAAR